MLRLPQRMEEILLMTCKGNMRSSEIADKLGISRQAVSKALREARARLTEIFLRIAEILNSDVIRISVDKGFAVLRSRQTGSKIYVMYIPSLGPLTIFSNKLDCLGVNKSFCRNVLRAAVKWGLIDEKAIMDNPRKAIEEVIKRMEE